MKAAEIRTQEDIVERLKGQPIEVSVWIAYRAAARVLPLFWQELAQNERDPKRDLTVLPVLRAILITGERSKSASPVIRAAAIAATNAAIAAANATTTTAAAAVRAAASAATAADAASSTTAAAGAAASATITAAAAATTAADAATTSGRLPTAAAVVRVAAADFAADAALVVQSETLPVAPLWPVGPPDWLADYWPIAELPKPDPSGDESARGPGPEVADYHSFWVPWYQGLLDGKEVFDPALLRDIALIGYKEREAGEPDPWDQGDVHINNVVIPRLMGKHKAKELINDAPFGLRIKSRPRKGVLYSEPVEEVDLAELVNRIRQSLKDFTARCRGDKSANQLGAQMRDVLGPAVADLRRDLSRHKADPHALFDAVRHAQREMGRIAHREGFPNEAAIERLSDELQTVREDIAVAAPSIVEVERKRLGVRLSLASQDHKLAALRMLAGMGANSEGFLRIASRTALLTILDDGADEEAKRNAWYFMLALVPRGAREMDRAGLTAASPKAAKDFLQKAAEAGDKLVKIDKGVDAMQEMGAEGVGWVTEAYTQIQSGNLWNLLG